MKAYIQVDRHWYVSENAWTLNGEHATEMNSGHALARVVNFIANNVKDDVTEIRVIVLKG
jgi:hypothetical protein